MLGKKKTFDEIKNEEINQDLALYYLFIYTKNYDNETPENKKEIREYYDTELRYKGSFYRDKKHFKQYGNPSTWTPEKKKRFKVDTYHNSYLSGMNIFKQFSYETTYLVNLDLNKPVSIIVLDIVDGTKDLNYYETEVKTEIMKLKNLIYRLDGTSINIMVKKGFEPSYIYDLSMLQIIYKIRVNNFIRYISTNFIKPKFIIDKGINKLNNYLSGLISLDEGIETENFTKPSNPKDAEIDVDLVEIERIHIVKRTNVFKHGVERNTPYPYELTQSLLTSIVVI